MSWTELVELGSGWRVPDDSGRMEVYLRRLELFAKEATQQDFWQFVVELRQRGLKGQADYMMTVYPAVRLYVSRFGGTLGRLIVGYIEASHAGEEEDEAQYFSHLREIAPDDRFVIWLSLLRRGKNKESDRSRLQWEKEKLHLLKQLYPRDSMVSEASARLEETGNSLTHPRNEDLWNRVFRALWEEYNARFPELLR